MKKALNIFLLAFYSFGSFCLPMGNFSTLKNIPDMYRHCKTTEDKDMTPLDFITDHLVNIDSIFDKHDNGDEQKPHKPQQSQHQTSPTVYFIIHFYFTVKNVIPIQVSTLIPSDNCPLSDYISKIFRPPMAT